MAGKRTIAILLRAEVDQYKRAMQDAAKSTEEVGKKSEKASRQFGEGWSTAAKPMLAVSGAITAIGVSALKTGISYNTLQQTSRAALTTLLGSAEAANAQMDKLDTFARTSPVAKQVFVEAQRNLIGFGMEASKVLPTLDAIQNAVAAFGGGNQDIAEITQILAQIKSQGKITAVEFMRLGKHGLDAANIIGTAMGKTGEQIRKEVTAGTIGADEALDALVAGMDEKFGGAAANVKETFEGALDRVKGAWRDLSSALAEPLVGKQGGGLAVGGLNALADFMRTVEGMPGPVKVAGVSIAGLTAATSGAMGMFLLAAPKVVAYREAVSHLSPATQAAIGSTGKFAKALAVVTAALVAASAVGSYFEGRDAKNFQIGTGEMTDALLDLAEGSKSAVNELSTIESSGPWGWNRNKIDGLADAFDKAHRAKTEWDLSFGHDSDLERGTRVVEEIDQALTQLVASGNGDQAAEIFKAIADETGRGIEMLPGYADALKNVGNESRLATAGAESFAAALGMTDEELGAFREESAKQAGAFRNFGDAVDAADGSVASFITNLRQQAKALNEFGTNAQVAAKRGLEEGLIRQFYELGPAGAAMLAELANASDREIGRANKAWLEGEAAAAKYGQTRDEVLAGWRDVPDEVVTQMRLDDQASARLASIRADLDRLRSGVTIGIRTSGGTQLQFASGGIIQRASGGFDEYGRNVPRQSQIRSGSQGAVMWGEPETGWEAYISGKPGMEARNKAIWLEAGKRLGAFDSMQAFAKGGFVEAVGKTDLLRMRARVRDMRRDLKATEKYGKNNELTRLKVRGLDRSILKRELAEALEELREQREIRKQIGKGKKYSSAKAYNRAQQRALDDEAAEKAARAEAREERAKAREKLAADKQASRDNFMRNFGSSSIPKSAAAMERELQKDLAYMAEFTGLIGQLKGRGASPWLLDKLIAYGPSKATNRVARQYLTDHQALLRVNALAAQADRTAVSYSNMVNDPKFTGGLTTGISSTDINTLVNAIGRIAMPGSGNQTAQLIIGGRAAGEILIAGQSFVGAHK